MEAGPGEDAAVANAANWLRLLFHALTCNNPACVLGDRCSGGKFLLSHVLTCSNPGACAVPSCSSVRRLALHWLRCQEESCRLCSGVWRDLSGSHDAQHERHYAVYLPPQERNMDSTPPEAPGTPDRNGPSSQSTFEDAAAADADPVPEGFPPSGRVTGGDHSRLTDQHLPTSYADRAVMQLQEATSYLRYLLHSLMCRHSRDAAARLPGLHFWLEVLSAVEMPPHLGARALPPAGRRLIGHRLTCQNRFCALCSGTCELFTRGQALRRNLPAPHGLNDMDLIVQELSLALGSVNL